MRLAKYARLSFFCHRILAMMFLVAVFLGIYGWAFWLRIAVILSNSSNCFLTCMILLEETLSNSKSKVMPNYDLFSSENSHLATYSEF